MWVEHVVARITSPRWATEDYCFLLNSLEFLVKHLKDVAVNPKDLLCNSIHFCIVLGASQGFLVLFDSEDLVPSSRKCKGNRITTSSSEAVDYHILFFWCSSDLVGNPPMGVLVVLQRRPELRSAKRTYFATGSGVTPNQASSVIQMPSSYFEKMSYLCCQYFEISKGTSFARS